MSAAPHETPLVVSRSRIRSLTHVLHARTRASWRGADARCDLGAGAGEHPRRNDGPDDGAWLQSSRAVPAPAGREACRQHVPGRPPSRSGQGGARQACCARGQDRQEAQHPHLPHGRRRLDGPGFNGGGTAVGNDTPIMDRLAAEGLLLTSAYSTPSCSPTRATIHTGQNPLHHGILRPPMYGEAGGLDGATRCRCS